MALLQSVSHTPVHSLIIIWFVCLLHFNEHPFRYLFQTLEKSSTHGPQMTPGAWNKQIKDCEKIPVCFCYNLFIPICNPIFQILCFNTKWWNRICSFSFSGGNRFGGNHIGKYATLIWIQINYLPMRSTYTKWPKQFLMPADSAHIKPGHIRHSRQKANRLLRLYVTISHLKS